MRLELQSTQAEVAELADAHDSNSCAFGHVGSIPTFGTCEDRDAYHRVSFSVLKLDVCDNGAINVHIIRYD